MSESESEITVTHDALLSNHQKWAVGEKNAASTAGERRQQIGAFAEQHGIENKALSQIRAGLKIKNEGKRLDWLRSMEAMLPMAANHIRGQGTVEMDLGEPEPKDPDPANETSGSTPGEVVGFDPAEVAAE